ncbi:MAG: hypothetical protein JWL76_481 [Thermoleophilia bacterium]|nr:hypothetical protein [Thermoleophilia bacterium]
MGFISALKQGPRLASAFAAATREGMRLISASRSARSKLKLRRRKRSEGDLVDFPGFQTGDELVIKSGTTVMGFDDVSGTLTLEQLEPHAVKLRIDGSIGPIDKTFEANLHQLNGGHAEFELSGFGLPEPFLVHVQKKARGRLKILPHGGDRAVTLTTTPAGDLRLDFPLGPERTVIVAGR